MIRKHCNFPGEYNIFLYLSATVALSKSLLYRVTCPAPSFLAIALLATTASSSSAGHIITVYHPRALSCFFYSGLQRFDCFSLATSTTASHSDSLAATFRDRTKTVPTRTIVHNNTSVMLLEAKAKTLEAAQ